MGASGIVRIGANDVQVILGPQAEIIAGEIKKVLEADASGEKSFAR